MKTLSAAEEEAVRALAAAFYGSRDWSAFARSDTFWRAASGNIGRSIVSMSSDTKGGQAALNEIFMQVRRDLTKLGIVHPEFEAH